MKIDLETVKETGNPPAVVLGLGQNGLATVRSLGRLDIPVIAIDSNFNQFTSHTRHCQKIKLSEKNNIEELISVLVDLGQRLPEKGVLFPSGDEFLYRTSENREPLEEYYHFSFPSKEIVRLSLDKKDFYQFANDNGITIPESYFPKDTEECESAAQKISYPCLIKPYQPNLGWRQRFPGRKLFKANNPSELVTLYKDLVSVHQDLIVQEIIPGKESNLSFSLTYFDSTATPLGMFTGRKIRQYPPNFGTSSLAESHFDPTIASKTVEILKAMRFTGYGSVEFKWDPRKSVFKAIEVTARTWFPHGISTACGLNLLYIAYCDLVGLPIPPDTGFTEGVKWIHEDRDLRSSLEQLRSGEITIGEWLRSYRGKRTYALAAWDDPQVFLHFIGHLASAPWRRARKLIGVRT